MQKPSFFLSLLGDLEALCPRLVAPRWLTSLDLGSCAKWDPKHLLGTHLREILRKGTSRFSPPLFLVSPIQKLHDASLVPCYRGEESPLRTPVLSMTPKTHKVEGGGHVTPSFGVLQVEHFYCNPSSELHTFQGQLCSRHHGAPCGCKAP